MFLLSPSVFAQSCRLGLGDDGDTEFWLEGTVGVARVRVYFNTEPDGRLTGTFYDVNTWSPVAFEGLRGEDCKFRIVETHDSQPRIVWEGVFKNRVFEGTRRTADSGENAAIRLQRIPDMDCDGKGKWIRLAISEFGVSLEYPENWRLAERSEESIRFLCPDPRAVQFSGSGVAIEYAGPPDVLTKIGRFAKSQGTWLVSSADIGGSCEVAAAFCTEARVSRRGEMTVVQGSGSTRLYLSGSSYQGLGEEEAYILLLKDRSFHVSSVLVKEGTTARIVRSVKAIR